MTILDRYLARAIVAATLIVLLLLVSIDAAFALLAELDEVGRGDYDFAAAAWYVTLTLPRRIYALFPTSVLLGALIGLGALATNSELVVMRAAGVSERRILFAALQTGLLLSLATLVMGEWAAPPSEQRAQQLRAGRLSGEMAVRGEDGLWVRDGARYINVKQLLPGLHLRGISVYELDARGALTATSASSGSYDGKRWLLRDVKRSTVDGDSVAVAGHGEEVWEHLVDPSLFDILLVRPDSLSLLDLRRYVTHLKGNDLDAGRYELALWRKLASPLTTLMMLLIALPFVFGNNRSLGGGHRLLIGSLIGIGYFLIERLISHMGLIYAAVPPVLSAFLPPLAFALVVVALLRRTR